MRALERLRRPPARAAEVDARSLADEFIDSWVCWREACEDVRAAYEGWDGAGDPDRALAFDGYRAALEREEQAARVHATWTDRVRAAAHGRA
jgi:hypothetical protein